MLDSTLGGYLEVHSRPPAFEGSDGRAYTVDILVDEEPESDGSYGAALLFVRWARDGAKPDGHVETDCLIRAGSADKVRAALKGVTLQQVKQHLDRMLEAQAERPNW